VLLLSLATLDMHATSLDALDFLPPTVPWNGKSRELMLPADDPWVTPAEISGLKRTPRYDETIAWLRRLADARLDWFHRRSLFFDWRDRLLPIARAAR